MLGNPRNGEDNAAVASLPRACPRVTPERVMRALSAAIAVAIGITPSAASAGQATCSNPGVPVGATASPELMPWRLTVALTTGILPISDDELLDETRGSVQYDARLAVIESRLSAELAIRPWLAFGAALPYRVVSIDTTYRDPATGEVIDDAPAMIHARDETLHGPGDAALLVHGARQVGGVWLHARVGTSLPLGRTEDDPFVLGSIGQDHQHVQLGTGTLIPFVAVEAQRPIGPVTASLWALMHASLYDNGEGYRAGDRYSAGATASTDLGLRAWSFGLAAEVHAETAETWAGVVHEDEGNAGRVDLLAGVSAAWRPTSGYAITADLKLPVYSRVV